MDNKDVTVKPLEFHYTSTFGETTMQVVEPINLPLCVSIHEYYHQLVTKHNIPNFARSDFYCRLKEFLASEERKSYNAKFSSVLDEIKLDRVNLTDMAEEIAGRYMKFVYPYAKPPAQSDEEIFAQAYSRLIHSPASRDLVQLEQSFAVAVATEVDKRDAILKQLDQRLLEKTERLLQEGNGDVSQSVTHLHETEVRKRDFTETQWNSCISDLKRVQRHDFREFVMSVEEQLAASQPDSRPSSQTKIGFDDNKGTEMKSGDHISSRQVVDRKPANQATGRSGGREPSSSVPWSECFTIQLGRQLRLTCNFRLIRADPIELLSGIGSAAFEGRRDKPKKGSRTNPLIEPPPSQDSTSDLAERMSNALSIYSNDLAGLVLLVDNRIDVRTGVKKRLTELCERSTDFHFQELDIQLLQVQETVDQLASVRTSEQGKTSNSGGTIHRPKHGDVYITRHSNLAGRIGGVAGGGGGVSLLFHVVVDDSVADEDRIRSPSPLHSSLTAILRTCFQYDVTTLSLPLLFVRHISEHMDSSWRNRRVETLFKAVKGVLLELTTWRGPVLRSIQFFVPPSLSDEEVTVCSEILTTCFQQPSPLVAVR